MSEKRDLTQDLEWIQRLTSDTHKLAKHAIRRAMAAEAENNRLREELAAANGREYAERVKRMEEALRLISYQPCDNSKNKEMFGSCLPSFDCLTEYCLPCIAKAALEVPEDGS